MRALLPAVTARLNIGPGPVTPSGPANPAEATRPDATMRKNAPHKIRRPEAGSRPRPSGVLRTAPGRTREA